MLDPVTQVLARGGLHRVAHGLDRGVADRVRGDLQTGARRPIDQLPQLGGLPPPGPLALPHSHPPRPPPPEPLDPPPPPHSPPPTPPPPQPPPPPPPVPPPNHLLPP